MPANKASLKITEAYRARMVGIRDRAKREARKTWQKVSLEDLDRTYDPGLLTARVTVMQCEAAQLSAGYLGAFIASETGKKIPMPHAIALQAGQARSGENLRKAFQNPLIGVKVDIKDGMDPAQALHKGGSRLIRQAGLATDEAAREALRLAMDAASEIVGYRRAVKGTCGACSGMADGSTLPPGTPLEIHPDCECVAEPQVGRKATELPPTPLSQSDKAALGDYVLDSRNSFAVNHYLRTGESGLPSFVSTAEARSRAAALDEVFASADPLGVPVQVWRGMRLSPEDLGLTGKRLAGQTFTDEGFGSAAGEKAITNGYLNPESLGKPSVLLEMNVSPEVRALWGVNPTESEMLLQRGCRYIVRGTTRRGSKTILRVDVLPPVEP